MAYKTLHIAAALLGTSLAGAALAHQPWVLTDPGHAQSGTQATIQPFFGHAFPYDDPLQTDRIAELIIVDGTGETVTLDAAANNELQTPELSEGVHVVALRQARGYWSQTTEGGRPAPRSELDNVVSCGYSDNGAKTLVVVGNSGPSAATKALGHRLEIILRDDITEPASGDVVEVRVLLEGEPHAGPLLAFHSSSGEDPYQVTDTDSDGHADVRLEGNGPWKLLAHGEIDYPEPAVCDVERLNASLTFGY